MNGTHSPDETPNETVSQTSEGERALTRRELRQQRQSAAAARSTPSPGESASGSTVSALFSPDSAPTQEDDSRPSFSVMDLFNPDAAEVTDPAEDSSPTILTVCTGNICRSPLAEVLLRARLSDVSVRVHSAGTHALVGAPMTEQARELARRHGGVAADADEHSARLLTSQFMEGADLVLSMTNEHSTFAVHLTPSRLRYVFPVRVFARLAATLTDEDVRAAATAAGGSPRRRLRAAVNAVAAQRGLVAGSGDDDDVIDPYRQSQQVYELTAEQLLPAIGEVERVVRMALDPAPATAPASNAFSPSPVTD